jgi:hypothetical protein
MADPELAFGQSLCQLLGQFGEARLDYITAGLQPFSNAQRPDVLFTPNIGGYADQVIFLEIKLSTKPLRDGRGFSNLIEHLEFVEESLEKSVSKYFYVTGQDVPEFSESFLRSKKIHVLDKISSQAEVMERLRSFSILP